MMTMRRSKMKKMMRKTNNDRNSTVPICDCISLVSKQSIHNSCNTSHSLQIPLHCARNRSLGKQNRSGASIVCACNIVQAARANQNQVTGLVHEIVAVELCA